MGSENSVALGPVSQIGTDAEDSVALGNGAWVLDGHDNSVAIGRGSRTSASHRIDFGAVSHVHRNRLDTGNRHETITTSYRFAGLSLAETGIGEADLMAGETFTAQQNLTSAQLNALTGAEVTARNAIIKRYRDAASSRALVVDGHGVMGTVDADLSNIGSVSQDSAGSGTIYQRIAQLRANGGSGSYDDSAVRGLISTNADAIGSYSDTASDAQSASLHARINKNRADIASFQSSGVSSDTMAQIQGNTQAAARASQGAANAAALSAIPAYLEPGKKLFLGLGAGSHDGKSATAIGIMGKWGTSTLLNAGFATGGGESTTRIGIGWQW